MNEHSGLPDEFSAVVDVLARWVADGPTCRVRAQISGKRDEMQALLGHLRDLLVAAEAEIPADERRVESLRAWIGYAESVLDELTFVLDGIEDDSDAESAERLKRTGEAIAVAATGRK